MVAFPCEISVPQMFVCQPQVVVPQGKPFILVGGINGPPQIEQLIGGAVAVGIGSELGKGDTDIVPGIGMTGRNGDGTDQRGKTPVWT